MRRIAAVLAVLACCLPALAVGPQDVTLTFLTRTGGGPVEGHRLYVNGALVAEVTTGSPHIVTGAIPGNGTYVACVNAYNTNRTVTPPVVQETAGGLCQTATLGDRPPDPPAPTDVTLFSFACELEQGPGECAVTFTPQP